MTQRGRQTERQQSSIHGFIPQVFATARAWPGRSQKPGTPSRCPMWVAVTQELEPSFAAFQWVSRDLNWNRVAGTQTKHSAMGQGPPECGGLALSTVTPTPVNGSFKAQTEVHSEMWKLITPSLRSQGLGPRSNHPCLFKTFLLVFALYQ